MKYIIYINKVTLESTLPAVNFSLGNVYGLAQAGADVMFMAQTQDPDFSSGILYQKYDLNPLDNLSIWPWLKRKKWGIQTNQWFYLDVFAQIRQWIKEDNVKAVISRDPGALPYLSRLNKKYQIPVFYQPHNFYVDLSIRDDVNKTNAKKYQKLERKYILQMTGLLCLQKAQADLFKKYFPDLPIYNAMPGIISTVEMSPSDKKYDIGYVGSLQDKKGVDVLLDAFKLLSENNKTMILMGGRNEQEIVPIQEKIQQMGLDDRITLTGYVPFHQVRNYLKEVRIGVLPLKNTFYNQFLTAPNKLFDYMGMGIPVIASDLPSIQAFIQRDREGLFVPPDDSTALAEAMNALLSDKKQYRHLAENALQTAISFCWQKRGEAMINMIEEAASKL